MSNQETVLIEGKHVGVIKIISILMGAFHSLLLVMKIFDLIGVNSEISMTRNYLVIQSWKNYRTEVIAELCGLIVAVILFAIILCLLGLAKITVTNKRVYGTAAFVKRVDIPIDSISAIGTGLFRSVVITSASGKLFFADLKNCKEIHSTISELLIKRQSNEGITKENGDINADALLKFKQLLDAGVITQEEFDVKKKQLLGL